MSMPPQETAPRQRSELSGLSSAEAASLRLKFGPNAVVEEQIHPIRKLVGHF